MRSATCAARRVLHAALHRPRHSPLHGPHAPSRCARARSSPTGDWSPAPAPPRSTVRVLGGVRVFAVDEIFL